MLNAQHSIAPTIGFDKHFAYTQAIQDIHGYFEATIILLVVIIMLLLLSHFAPEEIARPIHVSASIFVCAFVIVSMCAFMSVSHDTTYARLNNTLTMTNHNVIKEYKLSSNFTSKKEYVYRAYNKQGKQIGRQYVSHRQIMPSDNIFAFGDK